MKYKILLLTTLSILFISCSSDNASDDNNYETATSLPLTVGNYWTYNVHNHQTTNIPESWQRDSLYVSNDTTINTILYKKMKTLSTPFGFYSLTLNNNGIRVDGNKLKMSGSVSFDIGLPTNLSFEVNDFIILNEGNSSEELSATSGTFNQEVDGYMLTFDYTLKSFSEGELSSFTSNGNLYNNINKTKIVLNLKIYTVQSISGIQFNIPIMNAQDVLISSLHFSKNIGLIYNKSEINYTLQSIPSSLNINLQIPTSGSQTQEEFLNTFLIN